MYHNRLLTESALQMIDEGCTTKEAINATGGLLARIAMRPETISAINQARLISNKKRFLDLLKDSCKIFDHKLTETKEERDAIVRVWKTMPGNTCHNDALNITARL